MIRVVSTCRDVPCYKVFQSKKHVRLLRRLRRVAAVAALDVRGVVADVTIEAETAVVDAEIIKVGLWDGVAA